MGSFRGVRGGGVVRRSGGRPGDGGSAGSQEDVVLDLAGLLDGEQIGGQPRHVLAPGAVEAVGSVDEQWGVWVPGDVELGDDQGLVRSVVMAWARLRAVLVGPMRLTVR